MIKDKLRKLIFVIYILSALNCFAEEQVVTPKEIFVGDTAELRYIFQSQNDLFLMADPSRVKGDVIVLDHTSDVFLNLEEKCFVKQAVLQRVGITYTLIMTFVPWVTGKIEFPELNLNELCGNVSDASPFLIQFSPVTVTSILKKTESAAEGSPISPLLLPGTNYILWLLISALIIILVFVGIVIAKFSFIVGKFISIKENLGYSRNAILTKRKLYALKKKTCSDADFACKWQQIMRSYLEYRFGSSFSSVTSSVFVSTITDMTGDMLNMEQENAVFSLQSLFQRTDYIRYAGGSIDSSLLPAEEHEAVFLNEERNNMIELTISDIAGLELQEKEMKKYGRV